jgi:hypothetical protein
VEKIVVVTKGTDEDRGLIELLKALFPECEIRIVSLNSEGLETCTNHSLSGHSKTDARGDSHGKHFDHR